jgi:CrcB protein
VTTVWLVLAGGCGAAVRYVVDSLAGARWSTPFPAGTLAINVSGSLLLGVLTGLVIAHGASARVTAIAGTGFCGGYTTFSAASVETVRLAEQRRWGACAAYTTGSIVLSLGAAGLGLVIAGV